MLIHQTFDVEFRKDGVLHDEAQATRLLEGLGGVNGLLLVCHGWNNDMADAKKLCDALVESVESVATNSAFAALQDRRFGLLRVFWPSKRFADADLIPGGGAAGADDAGEQALDRLLTELANDPPRLGEPFIDPQRGAHVERARTLVKSIQDSPDARREFVLCLRALLNPDDAHAEDASAEFFAEDAETLFEALSAPVQVPAEAGSGGAASLDGGGASFLGDLMSGARAGARRLANFATYYQMKSRAGVVGTAGVAPLLLRVRERHPALPLHLVGHSFGGRVVTAAASRLPAGTRAVTMMLLQSAFSHNALASRFDGTHDGAFRTVLADRRVAGPVLITHTKNDRAVGTAYPLASRISRDVASALGDRDDPYGGIGRNGALFTPEAEDGRLAQVGHQYAFAPNRVFNLQADEFIADHSDVKGREVAYALLHGVLRGA